MAESARGQRTVCICESKNSLTNDKRQKSDREFNCINKNAILKSTSYIVNRLIFKPSAFARVKAKYSLKVENFGVLTKYEKRGIFIYANKLSGVDNYALATVAFNKKRIYTVGKDCKIPFPVNALEEKNFSLALERLTLDRNAVLFFTEDKNTLVNPFRYPVQFCDPSFTMSVVLSNGEAKKPKLTVYIDGPFFANYALTAEQREEDLKNRMNETIIERLKSTKEVRGD